MVEERAFWLAWSQVQGVGPISLQRLLRHFGTLSEAWQASSASLGAVEGFGPQTVKKVLALRSQLQPAQFLQTHQQKNPHFWTPADADYPRLLLEIADPPPVLYYQGIVDPEENQGIKPLVAIVGTRNPTEYGRRWTRRLSKSLSQRGFTVISGLAEGIDTEAHRSCLRVGKRTIAVLGTGVDVVYPWRNQNLYEEMLQCGLVLSEYPAGTSPDRTHFPRRNRIIAGLSRAVLVMEAGTKSGALITAHCANNYNRDVYALPGSLDSPRSLGCLSLASQGAQLIQGEAHLLSMLGAMPQLAAVNPPSMQSAAIPNLEPELQQVLQSLTDLNERTCLESIPFDSIVQQTHLAPGLVSSALLQLELHGLIVQMPGLRYQKR